MKKLISLSTYVTFLYNGEAVFANVYDGPGEEALLAKYYEKKAENTKRSRKITEFTYRELSMVLDYCYGLKDSHRISSFEKYFDETGLEERLLAEDAVESSKAMYELMRLYLADGTMLRISGYRRLGLMINGAVYDIDKGVEPDYPISTLERFFDRKALTEYIDSLY